VDTSQLTQLVEIAPLDPQWLQEIKLDGWALLPSEDDVVHDRNAQTAVIREGLAKVSILTLAILSARFGRQRAGYRTMSPSAAECLLQSRNLDMRPSEIRRRNWRIGGRLAE
jgi:hypothetical protein